MFPILPTYLALHTAPPLTPVQDEGSGEATPSSDLLGFGSIETLDETTVKQTMVRVIV